MLNCFKDYQRRIHISYHILDIVQQKAIFTIEQPYMLHLYLSYPDNTMSADALATLGAKASTGMLLTPKAGIFCLQHQKN